MKVVPRRRRNFFSARSKKKPYVDAMEPQERHLGCRQVAAFAPFTFLFSVIVASSGAAD
jgi:hypothetical protein